MNQPMDELRAIVMRAENTWTSTAIPRLRMVRGEACSDQVYEPMIHLVLQGTKILSIGDQILQFEPATYFVVPVDVPAIGQIGYDKPDACYLALSLTLDPVVIAGMLAEQEDDNAAPHPPRFSVSTATPDLIDACLRMMRLIDRPKEVAMLAPMIEREILFRVLQGPQGDMLRQAFTVRRCSRRASPSCCVAVIRSWDQWTGVARLALCVTGRRCELQVGPDVVNRMD
ncbi:MAG: AraC family transcriptional regulator [Hyphomicrobiales bacterium]|nr:MAG: AraC family transcriptional regulator [Hyphomicrobiales bacterium]